MAARIVGVEFPFGHSFGVPGDKGVAEAASDAVVQDIRRAHERAAGELDVFGVPTFFVGERSFWGNDRIPFVERELRPRS